MSGSIRERVGKAYKWISRPSRRRTALTVVGWLLGKFLCSHLPPEYQAPCAALAQLGSFFQ